MENHRVGCRRSDSFLVRRLRDRFVRFRYDVTLMFTVVHGNDRTTNRSLFEKLSNAIESGGHLVILDRFGDPERASIGNTGTAFLDLPSRISLGGRTIPTLSPTGLTDAGFPQTDRVAFRDQNLTLPMVERDARDTILSDLRRRFNRSGRIGIPDEMTERRQVHAWPTRDLNRRMLTRCHSHSSRVPYARTRFTTSFLSGVASLLIR